MLLPFSNLGAGVIMPELPALPVNNNRLKESTSKAALPVVDWLPSFATAFARGSVPVLFPFVSIVASVLANGFSGACCPVLAASFAGRAVGTLSADGNSGNLVLNPLASAFPLNNSFGSILEKDCPCGGDDPGCPSGVIRSGNGSSWPISSGDCGGEMNCTRLTLCGGGTADDDCQHVRRPREHPQDVPSAFVVSTSGAVSSREGCLPSAGVARRNGLPDMTIEALSYHVRHFVFSPRSENLST